MNKTECTEFMKNFFEKYYEKLLADDPILVQRPGVPKEMWADGVNPKEEWKQWKLIPSTIADEDIQQLEENWGIPFPDIMKAFLTTYFHSFEAPIGRHTSNRPFYALHNAWNPILVKVGYLPFTWDEEHYLIRCIDLANMPNEDNCPVCQIDHEILFDFDENSEVNREEIESNMEIIADNFTAYLNGLLD